MPVPKIKFKSDAVVDSSFSPQNLVNLLLENRGILGQDKQAFLAPPSPTSESIGLKLQKADRLIRQAIKGNLPILIYGDYDVDGITATALLWQALTKLRANVYPFIPDRQTDGYGFKADSFLRVQRQKNLIFRLLITVDNGIVAQPEFNRLKSQKLQILVVDHHLPGHPKLKVNAKVHSTKLAASGLAWFLANRFTKTADQGLAALGTVADSMPLTGVNRNLVFHGLNSLRVNPNPGLKKLIETCGLKPDSLSAYDLGFVLGPRINAVGRLSNPTDALRLICCQNPRQASQFAATLNSFNQDRQQLQSYMLDLTKVIQKQQSDQNKLVFVSHSKFHPGVIGLIASRLTDEYYLPSVIISEAENIAKGSCRSIPEINIIEVLREYSDLFVDLGGHAAAAGFSIESKNIPILKKKLTSHLNLMLQSHDQTPSIEVDSLMKLSAVTLKNIYALQSLEPFGLGNPKPLFLFKNLKIISKRIIGSSFDHLKLKLDDPLTPSVENIGTDAIAFRMAELTEKLVVGQSVDLIAQISSNTWNGTTFPQLVVSKILL
ncbi:MAG: single-stranded-DNA-specific exonuclease RecJ [Candidatus Shapirobacteria bacterium]|jgi:single-stranded-DNA-specific exonuclease